MKRFFTIGLCLINYFANAQSSEFNITPPSNEIANYLSFSRPGVNLSKGVLDLNIPLASIDAYNYSLPVTLGYDSRGIKVQDVSSRVGTNWNLYYGGFVARNVIGNPDEKTNGYQSHWNQLPTTINSNTDVNILENISNGIWDSQPDEFSFVAGSYSGSFIIGESWEVLQFPKSNVRIEIIHDNPHEISQFNITTPDGIIYKYYEVIEVVTSDQPSLYGSDQIELTYPSTWFLKKIILNDESEIIFSYENINYEYSLPKSETQYINTGNISAGNVLLCPITLEFTAYNSLQFSTQRIKEINYNETKIYFEYNLTQRVDLDNDYLLKKITTFFNNEKKRTTDFSFSNYSYGRPKLDGIHFLDKDDNEINKYGFEYFPGAIPIINSNAVDAWGYFNGANTNDDLLPGYYYQTGMVLNYHYGNRMPDFENTKKGVLKKIIYPTGGNSEFEYELNSIGKNVFGAEINDTTFNTTTKSCLSHTTGASTMDDCTTSFTIDHTQIVKIHISCNVGCQSFSADVINNNTSQSIFLNSGLINPVSIEVDEFYISLEPGVYIIQTSVEGLNNTSNCGVTFKEIENIDNSMDIGGLRVKSITENDGINQTNLISTEYSYYVNGDENVASGRIYSSFDFAYPTQLNIGNIQQNGVFYTMTEVSCDYMAITRNNLSGTNQNNIYYSEVREQKGDNAELGYSVYNFSELDLAQLPNDNFDFPYVPFQLQNWQIGKLIQRREYDSNSILKHKDENTYSGFNSGQIGTVFWKVVKVYSSTINEIFNNYSFKSYQYYSNHYLLTQTKSYDYLPSETVIQTENYYYDNSVNRLLTKKVAIQPDYTAITTYIKYPQDYTVPANYAGSDAMVIALEEMINRNIISEPIETYHTIGTPPYTNLKLIDANISLRKTFNGMPQMIEPFSFAEKGEIFSNFIPSNISSGSFVYDQNYESESKINIYSNVGDPLEIADKVNHKSCLFWNENHQLVAVASRSARNTTAYTSFETEDEGRWQYVGNAIDGTAITGKKYYDLTVGNIIYDFSYGADYQLSFWSSDAVTVNISSGGTATENGNYESVNGFTLHQFKIENATSSSVLTISGSANIDELRLYLKGGKMVSAYYEPLCGIATYCDANNYLTNAGYDSYQRKQSLSDHYGNLLGYFDYHFQTDIANGDWNYSMTQKILQQGKTISDVQGILPGETIAQTLFQYIDGLGRNVQDVGYKQSPLKRDVIIPHDYDEFGREIKKYEPFTKSFNSGQYVSNALWAQQSFHLSNLNQGIAATNYAYSESAYDNSPLQRKLTDASPGYAWRMGGHNVHYDYNTNIAYEVKKLDFDATNQTFSYSLYNEATLWKLQTQDEDGHLVISFKDMDGKIVREVRDDGSGNRLNTYYCYDLLGQLLCVIPPKASEELAITNTLGSDPNFVKKWCFRYKYNERGWLIAKAEPGKDWTYFVYDKFNRVAFTQDPRQLSEQKISFVKYDALGREIESGEADVNTETVTSLQTLLLASSTTVFESRSATSASHYTEQIAPTLTYHFDRINYYDDYDFDNDGTDDVTVPGNAARSLGLITGIKSFLSGNTTGLAQNYEMSVSYYDYKGAMIRTETTNFEGRTDNTDYTYNFIGNVIATHREHEKQDATTMSVDYVYEYDHAGRPTKTSMAVDGQPMHAISKLYYNEMGQVRYKSLNGKPVSMGNFTTFYYQQSINFKYNERRWLTAINGTDAINDNSEKFWGEDIQYGTPLTTYSALNSQTTYNGNISCVAWKGKRDGIKRGYGYEYDGFDRLTDAHYKAATSTGAWTDEIDRYTVDEMSYDANGNIQGMKVQGIIDDAGGAVYGTIDDLSYTYDGNVLKAVNDAGTGVWNLSPDFRDNGINTTNEYDFDVNLNMVQDDNKNLDIEYNSLNLPTKFAKGINDHLKITYGGSAEKLQEVITENAVQTGVQQYFGDIVYKYNELSLANEPYRILHPEGYWQWNPEGGDLGTGAWEDYYFIKDHLGNVRVVFYGKDFKPSIYELSMEATLNEQGPYPLFYDVNEFRNGERSYEGEFAARIGNEVGPNIRIPVKNRDSLEIVVWYYYDEPDEERGGGAPQNHNSPLLNVGFKTLPAPQQTMDGVQLKPKIVPSIGINIFQLFHKNKDGSGHHGGTRDGEPEDSIPDGYIKLMLQDSAGNTLQVWQIKADKGAGGWIKIGDSIGIHLQTDTNEVHQLYLAMQNDENIDIWFDTLRVKHLKVLLPIVQENHYYPYGNLISDICFDNDCNSRELYNTKEMHNQLKLDLYNYGARWYDPQVGRWMTEDPLSGSMASESSFSYCFGNPIKFIDQFGLSPNDWVRGIDKKMEFDPDVHNQEQAETVFGKGAEYVGPTFHETTSRGFIDYRKDGSIWYSNQTDAYNRMWDNSINGYFKTREETVGIGPAKIKTRRLYKFRNEELAIIMENGVLVMPNYLNTNISELESYGYSLKEGILYDPVLNKNRSIIATIHTHPIPGDPSPSPDGDEWYYPYHTSGKLFMTMGEYDGSVWAEYGFKGENTVYSLETQDWLKVKALLNGYDLRKLAKDNIKTK